VLASFWFYFFDDLGDNGFGGYLKSYLLKLFTGDHGVYL